MSLSGQTIAVTGATGFLGSYVVSDLLARGATVRAVVRNPAKAQWLREQGVELAVADLSDGEAMQAAFQGSDALVNTAALAVRTKASWEAFHAANTVGTQNLMRAVARAGVRRVVYVSTIGVYRGVGPFRVHDESLPLLTRQDTVGWTRFITNHRYALSKALGEKAAWDIAAEHGIGLTVLRPGPIWGARDHKITTTYRRLMRWPVLPAPTYRLPHVHAADIAAAAGGALLNAASKGRAYNVTGTALSPWAMFRAWKRRAGRGPLLFPVFTPVWIDFDNSAAQRDLGYQPRSLEAAIEEIVMGAQT
jgi:nucleoside-diphosphate-sugar epimerase